jgi:hypothetical protein
MKLLVIIAVFLIGPFANADEPALDLSCGPNGVVGAGYRVIGYKANNGYHLTINKIGYSSDSLVFDADTQIKKESADGKCRFRLVDDVDNPRTVLWLRPGTTDLLEKLNGKSLLFRDGDKVYSLNGDLSCDSSDALQNELDTCK